MKLAGLLRFFENAEKRERKRRRLIHERGRLGEAHVTDSDDTTLFYSYSVGGVHYQSSQDISTLRDKLPSEPERLLGIAHHKYLPNSPANSMLVCEDWCGLRATQPQSSGTSTHSN
jgi:hypothetical protein